MGKNASCLFTLATLLMFTLTLHAQEEVSAAGLYNEGLAKLKEKEYGEALPLLKQAVETADPEADAQVIQLAKRNGAIAAYYVGNDLRKEGSFDNALETYDMGIAWSPAFYANYIGRAQSLEDKGMDEEAIKAYLQAADVSEKGKKGDKAEQMFSKAENMVALAYGAKNWDQTVTLGKAFLEAAETPDVHYYLALALKEKGQAAQAVEHARKAVDSATEDKDKYLMALAESFEGAKETDKAIETYKMISDGKYSDRAKYKVSELEGGR